MKIKIAATVDIDPEVWASEYGIERSEVREDVKRYYTQTLALMAHTFNQTGAHQI